MFQLIKFWKNFHLLQMFQFIWFYWKIFHFLQSVWKLAHLEALINKVSESSKKLESGEFSDLLENFPQFQFIKFVEENLPILWNFAHTNFSYVASLRGTFIIRNWCFVFPPYAAGTPALRGPRREPACIDGWVMGDGWWVMDGRAAKVEKNHVFSTFLKNYSIFFSNCFFAP